MLAKTKKNLLLLSLVLLIAISFSSTKAFAKLILENNKQIYGLQRFTYISGFQDTFDISDTGEATNSVSLSAYTADQVSVSVYLQQNINGTWFPYNNWTDSDSSTSITLNSGCNVTSGYSYRIKSYGYVYIGGYLVESTSITGNPIYY